MKSGHTCNQAPRVRSRQKSWACCLVQVVLNRHAGWVQEMKHRFQKEASLWGTSQVVGCYLQNKGETPPANLTWGQANTYSAKKITQYWTNRWVLKTTYGLHNWLWCLCVNSEANNKNRVEGCKSWPIPNHYVKLAPDVTYLNPFVLWFPNLTYDAKAVSCP